MDLLKSNEEKYLVGAVYKSNASLAEFSTIGSGNWIYDATVAREVQLPSGRRMDLYLRSNRKRAHMVVEAKQSADHRAIRQVIEYRDELLRMNRDRIGRVEAAVIARTFTNDALFFAKRLGVSLVQFVPITETKFRLFSVVACRRYRFESKRYSSFEIAYEVSGE